jgi:hypothetical protein
MSNPEVSNWIVWQRAWLFVRMFPASLGWLLLGVVLAVQDWPADTVLGLPAGLLLMLVCWVWPVGMSMFRWAEEFEWLAIFLPRGDWRRWQDFRAERESRLAGYSVAYDLALVLPVHGGTEEARPETNTARGRA